MLKKTELKFKDLKVNQFFLYYGSRTFNPFSSRPVALASVIGIEKETGIIHVRTYHDTPNTNENIDIAHLPILFSALKKSVYKFEDIAHINDSLSIESILLWRQKYEQGLVGAFIDDLWQAEEYIHKTVYENYGSSYEDNYFIEYGFPKINETGKMTIVECSLLKF